MLALLPEEKPVSHSEDCKSSFIAERTLFSLPLFLSPFSIKKPPLMLTLLSPENLSQNPNSKKSPPAVFRSLQVNSVDWREHFADSHQKLHRHSFMLKFFGFYSVLLMVMFSVAVLVLPLVLPALPPPPVILMLIPVLIMSLLVMLALSSSYVPQSDRIGSSSV